jgi:hypothetical protein
MPREDPEKSRRRPVQREVLSHQQLAVIHRIHDIFAEVDELSFKDRIESFKRDLDPDRELAIWEKMADAYLRFSSSHELRPAGKKEAYSLLLARSMASEEETLDRVRPRFLSRQEALEVLQYMR